ncbi:restriction endonuclease subunit S [Psychrobacillus sp. FSL W7-1457]|uniref:restriction endonuclease subunit S n=1 Tax=Psychrobacillus sp. FSL W7-1457 TaxID=2954547 RepID=UPI003159EAEF
MEYKIDNLFVFIRNGANIKQGEQGGYPITRIETISMGEINRNKMGYAGIEDITKYESYVLEQDDILMSHINSEKHLGKTALYEKIGDEIIIHGMNLLGLRAKKELIVPKYAIYLFQTLDFRIALGKIVKKSVNQASFAVTDFKKIKVNIPSLEKQRCIVQVLDSCKSLMEKRQSQITSLDELSKSLFLEMFGDPVYNTKKWMLTKLNEIGDWKTGGTPLRSEKDYYTGDIPWLSSGELNDIYTFDSQEHITERAIKESSAKCVEEGSLLLGMYDTAALKSTINKVPCTCNQAIAFAKIDESIVSTIYLYYFIQFSKEYLKREQRGVRQKNLNLSMIKNLIVMKPHLDLQKEFEEKVLVILEKKELLKRALIEVESLYKALLQKAFIGELFQDQV